MPFDLVEIVFAELSTENFWSNMIDSLNASEVARRDGITHTHRNYEWRGPSPSDIQRLKER